MEGTSRKSKRIQAVSTKPTPHHTIIEFKGGKDPNIKDQTLRSYYRMMIKPQIGQKVIVPEKSTAYEAHVVAVFGMCSYVLLLCFFVYRSREILLNDVSHGSRYQDYFCYISLKKFSKLQILRYEYFLVIKVWHICWAFRKL